MQSNDLLAALGRVGKLFYDAMLDRLNQGNYPHGDGKRGYTSIQDATSVKPPEKSGGDFSVKVVIDLGKAPYAGAYEEGSGLQGPNKATYPIEPKASKDMVFPEGDWPGFVPGATSVAPRKGFFFLTHVEHPGVAKKPYIQPTIAQVNGEVKKILGQEFKTMVLREGKPMETIK